MHRPRLNLLPQYHGELLLTDTCGLLVMDITSTERDPVHEFAAPGCSGIATFNVRMTVTDADGCTTTVRKTITVNRKPQLIFDDTENPYNPFKHCPEIIIDPAFDVVLEQQNLCILPVLQVTELTGAMVL